MEPTIADDLDDFRRDHTFEAEFLEQLKGLTVEKTKVDALTLAALDADQHFSPIVVESIVKHIESVRSSLDLLITFLCRCCPISECLAFTQSIASSKEHQPTRLCLTRTSTTSLLPRIALVHTLPVECWKLSCAFGTKSTFSKTQSAAGCASRYRPHLVFFRRRRPLLRSLVCFDCFFAYLC